MGGAAERDAGIVGELCGDGVTCVVAKKGGLWYWVEGGNAS